MTIIAVGKLSTKGYLETFKHYAKQMSFNLIELKESTMGDEGKKILQKLQTNDYVVTLEIDGTQHSSESFAAFLDEKRSQSKKLVFVIGGSEGLSEDVKKRSQAKISLSNMTLPHQLARVVLVEQLYRAEKILQSHPYHK